MKFEDRLEELKLSPDPWCEEYVYGAIRHVERNVDQEAFHIYHEDCTGGFGRYDGTAVAKIRNALPRIIAVLRAARALDAFQASGPLLDLVPEDIAASIVALRRALAELDGEE